MRYDPMTTEATSIVRWRTAGSIVVWASSLSCIMGCGTTDRTEFVRSEGPRDKTNLVVEVETTDETWAGEDLYIAVFQDPDRFLDNDAWLVGRTVPVTPPLTTVVFEDIPSGPTAISGFIDLVKDSNLTRNFIGLPKEPWGFSKDISILLGKPDFADAAVVLEIPEHRIRFAMGTSLDRSDVRRRRAAAEPDG